jgi:hypothetical protein
MGTISMLFQEAKMISATAITLVMSDLAFGIIVAIIFGCIIFMVKYGKNCRDSITWIIDICKMNIGKGTGDKEQESDSESSTEEFIKEEIAEIKEQISTLSQQIKAILAEIKQIRKTEVLKALEHNFETASTEYAMKFELKRPEYDKAMRILQVTLAKIPEEGAAYSQKVIVWIAKAQKKFDEYSPENFGLKVEAIKARRRGAQNK